MVEKERVFFSFQKIAEAGNFQKQVSLNLFSSSPTIVLFVLILLLLHCCFSTKHQNTRPLLYSKDRWGAERKHGILILRSDAAASLYTHSSLTLHTGTLDWIQTLAMIETPYWSVINWLTEQWHINADNGAKKFQCWLMLGENKRLHLVRVLLRLGACSCTTFFLPAV